MLNIAFRLVAKLRRFYWWLFRPTTIGVKAIVEYEGKILLIKNRYDSFWYLPGGGVRKGETLIDAIVRELKEECNIQADNLRILGAYSNFSECKNDYVILFGCKCINCPVLRKGIEIEKCSFYEMDSLPKNISPATRKRLNEYQENIFNNGKW